MTTPGGMISQSGINGVVVLNTDYIACMGNGSYLSTSQ
jgi:hypothetical protein